MEYHFAVFIGASPSGLRHRTLNPAFPLVRIQPPQLTDLLIAERECRIICTPFLFATWVLWSQRERRVSMPTIVCNWCLQEKAEDEFNWKLSALGIRQRTCRECQKVQKNDWYARNSEIHKANVMEDKRANRIECHKFVWEYLLAHPCVDCGESDPIVLEFDHVRGKKRDAVSNFD